jgi:hypothetical protein
VPAVIVPEVRLIPCCDEIVTVPVVLVTLPSSPMPPAPVWSNVIAAPPEVVSDVTETAVPDVLLMSILPAVVSAETKNAARSIAPVVPMPWVALRSTVLAVIRLLP